MWFVFDQEESVRLEGEVHKSLEQSAGSVQVRHQDSIFEDNERSRLLQKLLQSKNPDDLQAANRLIKTMVKEVGGELLAVYNTSGFPKVSGIALWWAKLLQLALFLLTLRQGSQALIGIPLRDTQSVLGGTWQATLLPDLISFINYWM